MKSLDINFKNKFLNNQETKIKSPSEIDEIFIKHAFCLLPQKQKPKEKNGRKIFWTIVIMTVILVLIILYLMKLNRDNVGTIQITEGVVVEKPKDFANKEYSCDYFTFTYPGIYEKKIEEKDVNNIIHRVILLNNEEKLRKKVAIGRSKENTFRIDEIPSVIIRKKDKGKYQETEIEVNGKKGLLFESRQEEIIEKVAFFFGGGYAHNSFY